MIKLLRRSILLLAALGFLPIVVVGSVSAQETSAGELMARANERYERGEYAEAAQQYEDLVARGFGDAAVYFNLGNAYLESGDLGRAILAYLRARELAPRDSDIRTNLDLGRSMTVDRVTAERGSLIESVSFLGRRWATPSELGIVALLLWTVTGLAIGALLVWRDFPLRRFIRSLSVLLVVATLTFFLLVVSMALADPYDNTGVVTVAIVDVVSGPGPQYAEEFTLHSGAQVRVTDSRHGWWRIALPGGELQGWVPAHAIEKVGHVDGG